MRAFLMGIMVVFAAGSAVQAGQIVNVNDEAVTVWVEEFDAVSRYAVDIEAGQRWNFYGPAIDVGMSEAALARGEHVSMRVEQQWVVKDGRLFLQRRNMLNRD